MKSWRDRYKPKNAKETSDPVPFAHNVKFDAPEPMHVRIRRMIRAEQIRLAAMQDGPETALEGNDLDPDVDGPNTPYEMVTDPETGLELTQEEFTILNEERARADQEIAERRKMAAARRSRAKAEELPPKKSKKKQIESDEDED